MRIVDRLAIVNECWNDPFWVHLQVVSVEVLAIKCDVTQHDVSGFPRKVFLDKSDTSFLRTQRFSVVVELKFLIKRNH